MNLGNSLTGNKDSETASNFTNATRKSRTRTFAASAYSLQFLFLILLLPLASCSGGGGLGGYGGGYGGGGLRTSVGGWIVIFLIGALLGAFLSQKLRRFRMYLLIALPFIVLFAIFAAVMNVAYAVAFTLGFALAWFLLRDKARVAGKAQKPTTFGSAEWADLEHVRNAGLIGNDGYWLGWFEAAGQLHPLIYKGDRHLLTVAPTRAGKGVSAIIPNLLTYGGSALVIDPKGENARVTAQERKRMGQEIKVVDPWGLTGLPNARFNPLKWLKADDPDVGENAYMLADAIVVRSGGGEDRFWDDESVALLWGFILYVALDERHDGERSLAGVRDLLSAGPQELAVVLSAMLTSDNPIVASTAARTLAKEDKVRSNVFTTVQSHTHFLDSPRMRDSLSESDFEFEELKSSKMTVYLVLPADRLGTFSRWLRLLIQQAITVNARDITVKPDKPILFLLDEMAALGKLTKVEEAYGLMAGFGMQLWGIVQDLSQLDRIYDKGWETFIGNSGVLQYFGSRDLKTAEYFSKLCGVGTIIKQSFSRSIANAISFGGGGSSNSNTTTQGVNDDHIARALALPDELMVLRKNQSLLLIENNNPIRAGKITWYTDQRLMAKGVNLKK
jgi:type IV secretion system protein VirD4